MTIKDGMKLGLGIMVVYLGSCLLMDVLRVVVFMLLGPGGGPTV